MAARPRRVSRRAGLSVRRRRLVGLRPATTSACRLRTTPPPFGTRPEGPSLRSAFAIGFSDQRSNARTPCIAARRRVKRHRRGDWAAAGACGTRRSGDRQPRLGERADLMSSSRKHSSSGHLVCGLGEDDDRRTSERSSQRATPALPSASSRIDRASLLLHPRCVPVRVSDGGSGDCHPPGNAQTPRREAVEPAVITGHAAGRRSVVALLSCPRTTAMINACVRDGSPHGR